MLWIAAGITVTLVVIRHFTGGTGPAFIGSAGWRQLGRLNVAPGGQPRP
jgi:hypothetical protein